MIAAPTNDRKVVDYDHGLDTIRLIYAAILAIGRHYSKFQFFESDRHDRLIGTYSGTAPLPSSSSFLHHLGLRRPRPLASKLGNKLVGRAPTERQVAGTTAATD